MAPLAVSETTTGNASASGFITYKCSARFRLMNFEKKKKKKSNRYAIPCSSVFGVLDQAVFIFTIQIFLYFGSNKSRERVKRH